MNCIESYTLKCEMLGTFNFLPRNEYFPSGEVTMTCALVHMLLTHKLFPLYACKSIFSFESLMDNDYVENILQTCSLLHTFHFLKCWMYANDGHKPKAQSQTHGIWLRVSNGSHHPLNTIKMNYASASFCWVVVVLVLIINKQMHHFYEYPK